MKIAVCEDTKSDALKINELIMDYFSKQSIEIETVFYENCGSMLEKFEKGVFQIIFLDILMTEGLNGIETAKRIRQKDTEVSIVFTTTTPNFAVDSYLLDASFYLTKPIEYETFSLAMKRCGDLIERYAKILEINDNKVLIKPRLCDLIYVESRKNDCFIFTLSEKIQVRASLSFFENQLNEFPFLRCHQSFIINLNFVKDMRSKNFELKNNVIIPISKSYMQSVKAKYREFLLNETRKKL